MGRGWGGGGLWEEVGGRWGEVGGARERRRVLREG